ncbi:hypothetical protein Ancab_017230 [Ancistrocladus abbreviatus]
MAPVSKRMAVVVGINYFNIEHKLHGCINDACAIQTLLISLFRFESSHVQVLRDESESAVKPTAANIKAALNKMIDQAEAGDRRGCILVELHQLGRVNPDAGILLSGCQADETSKETSGCGVFSKAIEAVFKEHQGPLTNRQVVTMARKLVKEQVDKQHPCLYCSDENADAYFLRQAA